MLDLSFVAFVANDRSNRSIEEERTLRQAVELRIKGEERVRCALIKAHVDFNVMSTGFLAACLMKDPESDCTKILQSEGNVPAASVVTAIID